METFKLISKLISKYLFIIITTLILYGCGFHLRGLNIEVPKSVQKLYIDNQTNDYQFVSTLKPLLRASNITIVSSPKDASATLVISKANSTNNMQSVTGNLSAGQYLVTYNVTYKIIDNKDHTLLPQRTITKSATYSSNATQQLSANNKVIQLTSDLRDEAASALIGSLSLVQTIDTTDENIIIPDNSDSKN
ncbi:hypothetical protein L3V86_01365 [Thiotrichales bacterium 19S11-10]|nr:hypothetical protein [Thiotrichales bacterium 19S11-10]MCF6808035.1 hypothetical protein [Thiotrichales bacterium 19S9-11]MCF6812050.1 hypothetical protein [Thiotrichales bacterium 19S9-12]